jgi:hypothetical protein
MSITIPANARLGAGIVALVGLAGLLIQLSVSLGLAGSLTGALWSMLRFFTIIGNGLAVFLLAAVAWGSAPAFKASRIGGIAVAMGLIGVVFVTLLRNTEHLTGTAQIANVLLHYVMPPLVVLYWLVFAPKGELGRFDPLRWAILPLAYFPYALARAAADGKYAYPFIDAGKLGWPQVLTNASVIALGFVLCGYGLVWLDRAMSRERAVLADGA